ncbi:MAG: hypothetical protein ACFFD2_06135 [Promethearchaeota archaeon]
MTKHENSKESVPPDLMTDLLRQMGLGEEEIGDALDLAESIEKKIELKAETKPVTGEIKKLSEEELINIVEKQKAQLDHFQNVVAVQMILLIKKYKDMVTTLENKINQKNTQIQELSQQLELLRK